MITALCTEFIPAIALLSYAASLNHNWHNPKYITVHINNVYIQLACIIHAHNVNNYDYPPLNYMVDLN